jgi:hypothetical protein
MEIVFLSQSMFIYDDPYPLLLPINQMKRQREKEREKGEGEEEGKGEKNKEEITSFLRIMYTNRLERRNNKFSNQ